MANAARVHAIEGGRDVGGYTMIAFGGGAPLHAAAVADKLGMRKVLIPKGAGVGSAIGFLRAPVAFETALSWVQRTDALDIAAANAKLQDVARRARELVVSASAAAPVEDRRVLMRYRGQGHEIEVRLPSRELVEADRAGIEQAFIGEYTRLYGRSIPGLATEIITWLVAVRSPVPPPQRLPEPPAPSRAAPVAGRREHTDARSGRRESLDLVERAELVPATSVEGPAVVVEDETGTYLPRGWRATSNSQGDLLLTRTRDGGTA